MANQIGNLIGKQFRFKSYNYQNRFFRHRRFEIFIDEYEDNGLYKLDSAFTIVPGLSGSGISFKSENHPNHFIRQSNFEAFLHEYDGSDQFKNDASWIPREGLANAQGYSFESVSYPERFMRHHSFRVRLDQRDGSDLFDKDATWLTDKLKNVRTNGEWKLVYGNDNEAADWSWSQEIAVGIEVSKSKSVSTTEELGWKVGMEAGAEGYGMSVKAMFEVSGMLSVTRMSASSWKSSHQTKTTKTYSGKQGEGFYLWQWNLYATTSDGILITVASSLYNESTVNERPEPLD